MPALAEAIVARDLLLIRNFLAAEAKGHLPYASPGLVASCTMVCLIWSIIVTSTGTREDAESTARCMVADTLALLRVA